MYGLADASRYWYLRVREELLKLGAKISSIDPGLFYWRENNTLTGILACHMDDMIWGGNQYFKETIITKLKEIFNFGSEEMEAFTYIGIELKQNSDFSVKIDQNPYIDSIQKIVLSEEKTKDRKSSLTTSEKTLYRSIVRLLNWVAGISRPDINFVVCESRTKFTHATVADIIYVNKIIRKIKSSRSFIQFLKLDLNTVKLQLFTDASFNNLSNGGSQAGQIILLTDSKNRTYPL